MTSTDDKRLARIESRLVRGFDLLGVDVTRDPTRSNRIRVDHSTASIDVDSLNITLSEIFAAGKPFQKQRYNVAYRGDIICMLITNGVPD